MNPLVPPFVITVAAVTGVSAYNSARRTPILRGTRSLAEVRCAAVLVLLVAGSVGNALAQSTVLADLHGFGPRQLKSQTFVLDAPQEVQIDAVGATATSGTSKVSALTSMFQHDDKPTPSWSGNAWVLDLNSRKVVWELSAVATTSGSSGTRGFKGSVRLPAGSYTAYYASFPDGDYWTDENGKSKSDRKWHWFGDEPVADFKLVVRGTGRPLAERPAPPSSPTTIVSLRGDSREQFAESGFVLAKPTEIEIVSEGEARSDGEFDFGWIVNVDTKATVWRFTWRDSQPAGGAAKNRLVQTSRTLPAGRYAAFYATDDSHDPSEWNAPPPHDPEAWGLTLSVKDRDARASVKTFPYEHVPQNATIVAITHVGNDASRKQGFTLTRPMDVRIYALGEGRNGRMFDYGWITSAGSRNRVWTMSYDNTEPAGGDRKNRIVDTTIHLDKGSYIVHYISDDSHSAEEWNAAAPPDGKRWGITVLSPQGPIDRAAITPYDEKSDASILAELTEVRDDEQVRKSFSLDRETDVRIYAIGEGSGGDLVDFGWIEDAKTGRRVWEMTYRTTEHAGGAQKNRRFDGVIRLPAGNYVLRYETDGSHSFGNWNAAPPDDPEAWGITVTRAGR